MDYKVVITYDAEADLDEFIRYLLFEQSTIFKKIILHTQVFMLQ